jgi:hypothetical protein
LRWSRHDFFCLLRSFRSLPFREIAADHSPPFFIRASIEMPEKRRGHDKCGTGGRDFFPQRHDGVHVCSHSPPLPTLPLCPPPPIALLLTCWAREDSTDAREREREIVGMAKSKSRCYRKCLHSSRQCVFSSSWADIVGKDSGKFFFPLYPFF